MSKTIVKDKAAQAALLEGIDAVADVVKTTLGPGGRVVLLAGRFQTLTKDGVSVARQIQIDGPAGEGAKLCIAVANKAVNETGDGTTTATVLAQALAHWAVAQNGSPREIKARLEAEGDRVCNFVQSHARLITIEDPLLLDIASIAGNSPAVGKLVADAWAKIGPDGIITHKIGPTTGLTVEPGYRLDTGLALPHFCNDLATASWVGEDVQVVLIEQKVRHGEHILPLLNKLNLSKPILLVADLEETAMATCLANANHDDPKRPRLNLAVVKVPGLGTTRRAYLDDLAALTGATVIDSSFATVGDAPPKVFGKALSARANQWFTVLITAPCPEEHLTALRAAADNAPDYMRDPINERIAKLTSGIAVLTCGGATEQEAHELRDRVDDAVRASRAALLKGVVPGAGWTLANAGAIQPFTVPQQTILNNAGYVDTDCSAVIDSRNGQRVDPYEAGIVDPVSVIITAVEAAVSIAKLVVDCSALIIETPDAK